MPVGGRQFATIRRFARECINRPLEVARRNRARSRRRRFYSQFVHSGDLVFDVGANHGNRVEAFVSLGAKVVAIEPQPGCVASLRRLLHRHPSKVDVVAGVVGPSSGTASIRIGSTDELSSLSDAWINAVKASGRFANVEWKEPITVDMTTLDALVSRFGEPAFIKIDVEGYELEVLRGLSKRPKNLRALSFEFTPERRPTADACLAECERLGGRACNFSEGESMRLALPSWVTGAELGEFLNKYKGDNRAFGDIYVRFA